MTEPAKYVATFRLLYRMASNDLIIDPMNALLNKIFPTTIAADVETRWTYRFWNHGNMKIYQYSFWMVERRKP